MTGVAIGAGPNEPESREDLRQQIIDVLLEIHQAYADSQRRSGSRHQRVYGQIFADLPDRLRHGLSRRRNDIDVRKVGHAGYQVPVIAGTLYFPWRPPGGARPEDVQFGGSGSREGLWRMRRESDTLPLFTSDGGDLVLDHPADPDVADSLSELLTTEEHLQVVIVAMTSSSHQVDRIEMGPAVLNDAGMLIWDPEVLWDGWPESRPASTRVSPFDSGLPPRPTVNPKVPETPTANG